MAKKWLVNFVQIFLIAIIPTFLLWLPFFLRFESFWQIPLPQGGMSTVVANYDGPLYIVVAKTLYNTSLLNNFTFDLPSIYYAAHFPLFPVLIKLFAVLLGFPYAMLFTTLLSTILCLFYFRKLASLYFDKSDLLWVTFLFAVFPARWLIVRSVGSAEPLFLAATIASVYYFKKEKFFFSGIWGSVAILTKSPGILLFAALIFAYFIPRLKKASNPQNKNFFKSLELQKFLPLLLIPLSLFGLFYIYKIQFNDFLAYFHSGDNIHLFFPPFQIFNYTQPWVGSFWLEDILFVYLFAILGLTNLIKTKDYVLAYFVGIFFASIIFVSHRDLIRYALPILPFLVISFKESVVKKEFKIAFLVLLLPIYLYSLVFISKNVMPISDWAPLL